MKDRRTYPLFADVKVGDKFKFKFETGGWNNDEIYTVVEATEKTVGINTNEWLLVKSNDNSKVVGIEMAEVIDKEVVR